MAKKFKIKQIGMTLTISKLDNGGSSIEVTRGRSIGVIVVSAKRTKQLIEVLNTKE